MKYKAIFGGRNKHYGLWNVQHDNCIDRSHHRRPSSSNAGLWERQFALIVLIIEGLLAAMPDFGRDNFLFMDMEHSANVLRKNAKLIISTTLYND